MTATAYGIQQISLHTSVTAATTGALPANTYSGGTLTATSNGALTVDGVTVSAGQRVLVKNEAAGADNGIYTCVQPGSPSTPYVLARAADMSSSAQVAGAIVFAEQGTLNQAGGWIVTGAGPFTLGSSVVSWSQVSGVAITGSQFVVPTGDSTGAVDYAAIDAACQAASPAAGGAGIVQLSGGKFYGNRPILPPNGVFVLGVAPATQAGDATNSDWVTTVVPVASGWVNEYGTQALPSYGASCQAAAAMGGVTASGFTGTFTAQAAPELGNAADAFPASGTLTVVLSSGSCQMTYTGKSGDTFTGCAVVGTPSGTFVTGAAVTCTTATYGQGGVFYFLDQTASPYGSANNTVSRCGLVNVWVDGNGGPAGVDGVMAWGKVSALTISGCGFNKPAGNGIGSYLNANFSGNNQSDGWNISNVIVEKGQWHGVWGYFQDTTMVNTHAQQCAQSGVAGDGFVIQWSHNLLIGCRSDLNTNGFTVCVQGGQSNSSGQYWAAITLEGCTTQRNQRNGLKVINTGTNTAGNKQQSPVRCTGCNLEGDGKASATSGAYAAIYMQGRGTLTLTGCSVHCYSLDNPAGCPQYALQTSSQGSGGNIGYPASITVKGGFWNAATALYNNAGGSPALLTIDVDGYGCGAFLNQSDTTPYHYKTAPVKAVTGSYQATLADETILVTPSGGAATVTLPPGAGAVQLNNFNTAGSPPISNGTDPPPVGKRYTIVKASGADANPVYVAPYTAAMTTGSAMNGVGSSGFTGTFQLGVASGPFWLPQAGTVTVATSTTPATMTWTGITTTYSGSTLTGWALTGCTVTAAGGNFTTGDAVTYADGSTIDGSPLIAAPRSKSKVTVAWDGTAWWVVEGYHAGTVLCAAQVYAPNSQTTLSVASATMGALDTTNAVTNSFVAPPSGQVVVEASFVGGPSVGTDWVAWGLFLHGTSTLAGNLVVEQAAANNWQQITRKFPLFGLTPGTVYQYDLCAAASGGSAEVFAYGQSTTTPTLSGAGKGAPVVLTVAAA